MVDNPEERNDQEEGDPLPACVGMKLHQEEECCYESPNTPEEGGNDPATEEPMEPSPGCKTCLFPDLLHSREV